MEHLVCARDCSRLAYIHNENAGHTDHTGIGISTHQQQFHFLLKMINTKKRLNPDI